QAERVQAGMNGLWRDIGHLGAIREVYRERGLRPPELPAELRTREDTAAPTSSGRSALTPEQQRHHALAQTREWHLAQAQAMTHATSQESTQGIETFATPPRAATGRAMA
ncbi:MAG: hypothetical protein R3E94_20205, partial [Burkholderiaceae bacterium]